MRAWSRAASAVFSASGSSDTSVSRSPVRQNASSRHTSGEKPPKVSSSQPSSRWGERCAASSARQLLLRHGERIPLALRGRQMVIKPRQDLPLLAHLKVDPAQAVQNPPVLRGQDEVRVAAHDLEDEVLLRGASHLVGAVEGEVQQPLHLRLLHPDQPPARQMLAQQHAEHRRLRRVFRRFIRQVDARMIGRGREQQFSAAGRAAHGQDQRVALRAAGPCPRGSRSGCPPARGGPPSEIKHQRA